MDKKIEKGYKQIKIAIQKMNFQKFNNLGKYFKKHGKKK